MHAECLKIKEAVERNYVRRSLKLAKLSSKVFAITEEKLEGFHSKEGTERKSICRIVRECGESITSVSGLF